MAVNTTNIKFNVMYDTAYAARKYNYIYRATGGGSVQSTNYAGNAAGFDYFDNSPSVNDAVYFGVRVRGAGAKTGFQKFRDIVLNVGTVLDGGTLVWEYYNGAWVALSVTNGDAMKNAGAQTVVFAPPDDMYPIDIGPGVHAIYVRCRMTNTAGVTEGGAQSANKVQFGTNCIHVHGNVAGSAVTLEDVYDTAVNQSWGCSPAQLEGQGAFNQAFYLNCYLEVGSHTEALTGFLDLKENTLIFGDDYLLLSWYDSNKIEGGVNNGDIFGCIGPTIRTNQSYRSEMSISWEGKTKLYGFNWFNSYQNAMPSGAAAFQYWEIMQFGTDDYNGDVELIDCTFSGFRYVNFQAGASDKTYNIKTSYSRGFNWPAGGDMQYLKAVDCPYGYRSGGTAGGQYIYGLEMANISVTYFSTWEQTETKYIRNPVNIPTLTTSNACSWGGSPLSDNTHGFQIQYSVDVEVVDQDGVAISGATVDLNPNGSDENNNNFNTSTAASGKITRQWVTEDVLMVDTVNAQPATLITNYDDFTLTITAAGYEDYVYIGKLDEPWDFRVSMTPTCAGGNLNLAEDLIKL